jgi:hypothetical protein
MRAREKVVTIIRARLQVLSAEEREKERSALERYFSPWNIKIGIQGNHVTVNFPKLGTEEFDLRAPLT